MSYRLARFLSHVLHPVLMPTYALILIFQLSHYIDFVVPPAMKAVIYSVIVFNTLLMPVLVSFLLVKRGYIRSLQMEDRQERYIPFMANAVLMMIAYYMLSKIALPKIFYLLMLGAVSSVVIVILINFKWKISIHMVGIGGITGMLLGMSSFMLIDLRMPVLTSLLVAGALGTARLRMGAHEPSQIYSGFFLGLCCEYFMLSL